ncbi:MAG: hypothetical protein WB660_07525, partial [Candidatus Sulfotelmatobacter sp.]
LPHARLTRIDAAAITFRAAGIKALNNYGVFKCGEFPIIGWRVCDHNERPCLYVVNGNPPRGNCLCEVERMNNVVAVKAVYPNTEFDFWLWSTKQRRAWENKKLEEVGS